MTRLRTRREVLGLAAAAGAAALAGCGDDDKDSPSPSPSPASTDTAQPSPSPTRRPSTATPTRTPAPTPTFAPTDWDALASRLEGSLLRPADAGYDAARLLFNPRFDGVQPAAVARPRTPRDVQACVDFARTTGTAIALRSGGHSYAGYSTGPGLVVDVRDMNQVTVDANAQTARVGAGARLIDVYSTLAAAGFALPAGSCATVGITGLALGGGFGVLDRSLGLTCDSITEVELVTADGRLVTCNANENEDLFWALRGGGGGNFGVVTSLEFRVYPRTQLVILFLSWPWSGATDVVAAWQEWAPGGPNALWANCVLGSGAGNPSITMAGVFDGSEADASVAVTDLIALAGSPASQSLRTVSLLDAMKIEAGCGQLSVDQCHLPADNPAGVLGREASIAGSAFFASSLPADGVRVLLDSIEARAASLPGSGGGVILDPMLGAIAEVEPDATAFVHRREGFSAQYYAVLSDLSPATVAANRDWVRTTREALAPYSSGHAYQNYIDPDHPDWLDAYYGANAPRLRAVKEQWDPENLFHFAQSVPT